MSISLLLLIYDFAFAHSCAYMHGVMDRICWGFGSGKIIEKIKKNDPSKRKKIMQLLDRT